MNNLDRLAQRGFTLMEMLGVVAIIALILGIGTPIVMNVVKDSKTEEFVSNAKVLEDSLSMYYRDNGDFGTGVKSKIEGASDGVVGSEEIDEKSKRIIYSELIRHGVIGPEEVLSRLLEDGKVKKINYDGIKEYTRIVSGDEGTEEFIYIDLVDVDELEKYGIYENELSGFVFSEGVRDKTTGIFYSGAHSMTKEENEKLDKDIEDMENIDEELKEEKMFPYGFRLVKVEESKDNKGYVDVTVSWTNRVTDKDGNLDRMKGFIGESFTIDCDICSGGSNEIYKIDKGNDGLYNESEVTRKGNTFIKTIESIPAERMKMSIKFNKISYAGKIVEGKESESMWLNGEHGDSSSGGDGIDLGDVIIGDGSGEGNLVCDEEGRCSLEEKEDGSLNDNKDDMYDFLEEVEGFNEDYVNIESGGIRFVCDSNEGCLDVGDIIVLKEFKKSGGRFTSDVNRTRVFEVLKENPFIPKNPYLSMDFQENHKSDFVYVIEAYKNKMLVGSKDRPDNPLKIGY